MTTTSMVSKSNQPLVSNDSHSHADSTATAVKPKTRRKFTRFVLWPLAVLLIAFSIIAFVFSRTPGLFDVSEQLRTNYPEAQVQGAATSVAVIEVVERFLNKTGGYLSNDVTPPSILLDNIPNWEFGVLTEVRDVVRAMRNDFSRAKSQSAEDSDLSKADVQFNFDHTHWVLPSAEDEYQKGKAALEQYLTRLQTSEAQFYARADNLNFYLATVEKRLGDLSQRLSASVREPFLRELISDYGTVPEVQDITPWFEIDDVFFEARGYVWALVHVLKGIEIDFAPVLKSKDATLLLQQIIEKLEHTQNTLFSPIVLNSTGFGMLSNHSLVMASYISRANAAVIDLRLQLSQG